MQFIGKKTEWPDWVLEARKTGVIQSTMNHKHEYVRIYSEANEEKALMGWWLCYDGDKIYAMSNEHFKSRYER